MASPQIKHLGYAKLRRLLVTKVSSPQNKATLRRSMQFSVRKKWCIPFCGLTDLAGHLTNSKNPKLQIASTLNYNLYPLARPRPGTCPALSPPSMFCPSDFDECKFDWDCAGETKKCCSNTCYNVCIEPAVGAIESKYKKLTPIQFFCK